MSSINSSDTAVTHRVTENPKKKGHSFTVRSLSQDQFARVVGGGIVRISPKGTDSSKMTKRRRLRNLKAEMRAQKLNAPRI